MWHIRELGTKCKNCFTSFPCTFCLSCSQLFGVSWIMLNQNFRKEYQCPPPILCNEEGLVSEGIFCIQCNVEIHTLKIITGNLIYISRWFRDVNSPQWRPYNAAEDNYYIVENSRPRSGYRKSYLKFWNTFLPSLNSIIIEKEMTTTQAPPTRATECTTFAPIDNTTALPVNLSRS